jgi:alginate O-acetyltransferase complex protein AlgI
MAKIRRSSADIAPQTHNLVRSASEARLLASALRQRSCPCETHRILTCYFNSLTFLFGFLPVALVGYQIAGRFGTRSVIAWLGFISVVFYAVWRYKFVILLLGSVLVNFAFSQLIHLAPDRARRQKWLMIAAIACNLLLLLYYKYLFPSLSGLHRLGILHHQFAGTLLPLGISFFTFTQIAYLVDLKEGSAEPQGFLHYLLFVTFFPHLIAGPILHHSEMMPQFKRARFRLNPQDLSIGFSYFVMGLFKKIILADTIAPAADEEKVDSRDRSGARRV